MRSTAPVGLRQPYAVSRNGNRCRGTVGKPSIGTETLFRPSRPPLYFDDAPAEELQTFQTTDADHGRIEVRRHVVSHNVDWLAEHSRFPGVNSIAMVENTVERNGETSCERRYYICSLVLLVMLFANAVRCHWHIENRLHWVLDVTFHEDLSGFAHRARAAQHGHRPAHDDEPAALGQTANSNARRPGIPI